MTDEADIGVQLDEFRRDFATLRDALEAALVGQREAIEMALVTLFAGGHLLLEGPPGVGKTLLGRTLAELLDVDYRRIKFTSDLMPADVIGTYVVMEAQGRRRFEFTQGPVFTNLLLADEINRATPKTQAALFEALEERQLTVANETYDLPVPFCAIATQSLGDIEGTFPIPETQLDRFAYKVVMELPRGDDLEEVLRRSTDARPARQDPVMDGKRIAAMSTLARDVEIAPEVVACAAGLVAATDPSNPDATESAKKYVSRGASPRAGQAMILGAKVLALVEGRPHASREDILRLAPSSLRHRIQLSFEGHAAEAGVDGILREILGTLP